MRRPHFVPNFVPPLVALRDLGDDLTSACIDDLVHVLLELGLRRLEIER